MLFLLSKISPFYSLKKHLNPLKAGACCSVPVLSKTGEGIFNTSQINVVGWRVRAKNIKKDKR